MKTTTNGRQNDHDTIPAPSFPQHIAAVRLTPREYELALAELDNWDSEIATLSQALKDQAVARDLLADASRRVEMARERCRLLRVAIAVQLAGAAQ